VKNVVLEYKRLEEEKAAEEKGEKGKGKEAKSEPTTEKGEKAQKAETTEKKGGEEKEVKVFNPEAVEKLTAAQLVGMVWEYTNNLGELSISNHIAIAQEMKLVAQLLQDAHKEVKALADTADSAEGGDDEGMCE
jgi:Grap2 and cyclin-D-interacting